MSSSNKTSLGLNLWSGSDKPQRIDFCNDNEIIDSQIKQHIEDTLSHVSSDDRTRWDKNVFYGAYAGSGSEYQTIKTKCPFTPLAAVVFAHNTPPYVRDTSTNQGYSYFGFASAIASSYGVKLNPTDKTLTVPQQVNTIKNEVMSLNNNGTVYCYLLFR